MHQWRLASCFVTSLLLTALALAFAGADMGFLLCVGIAFFFGLWLVVRAFAKSGKQRFLTLAALGVYLVVSILLLTHYSLVRDHVRWFALSGGYKARVLAQSTPTNEGFKHVEWDGWGFAGIGDTTVFLVFDPNDSLAQASRMQPPVKARGLPCEVYRVRRLEKQWYAVGFYTETYWGQGSCK
jgi:hypothetical protein